jgi:hypothetical protein
MAARAAAFAAGAIEDWDVAAVAEFQEWDECLLATWQNAPRLMGLGAWARASTGVGWVAIPSDMK